MEKEYVGLNLASCNILTMSMFCACHGKCTFTTGGQVFIFPHSDQMQALEQDIQVNYQSADKVE